MSIQPIQLLTVLIFLALVGVIVYVKNKWLKIIAAVIILIAVFASPVKFKQENARTLERDGPDFTIPEKIDVEHLSHEEVQRINKRLLEEELKKHENEIYK